MKKVLALFAFVLALSINATFAQTTTKSDNAVQSEQTAVKATPAPKACCASHGAKASTASNDVKTASTTHEHAGKTCDPANCTEADKKACAKATGKACCGGAHAKSDAKTEDAPRP